jgi:hypothetical protein
VGPGDAVTGVQVAVVVLTGVEYWQCFPLPFQVLELPVLSFTVHVLPADTFVKPLHVPYWHWIVLLGVQDATFVHVPDQVLHVPLALTTLQD